MKQRLFFLLVFSFWVTMNILLWRFTSGARVEFGAPVSPSLVWQRIITAPDNSSLEIFHKDQKIGACRWSSSITEDRSADPEAAPDGMIRNLVGYTIDFDGNLMLKEADNNFRFYFRVKLSTNDTWQTVNARITLRPAAWEFFADSSERQLVFRLYDGEAASEHVYRFEDLATPQKILRDFEMSAPLAMLAALGMPMAAAQTNLADIRLGLSWQANNDQLKIGRASARVYRLRTQLFDHYEIKVYISRAGELLRVELPGDIVMVNYALTSY